MVPRGAPSPGRDAALVAGPTDGRRGPAGRTPLGAIAAERDLDATLTPAVDQLLAVHGDLATRSTGGRWTPAPHGSAASRAERIARRCRGRRGQALVELALVMPLLLLLMVAALDFGRVFYSLITISNAAREGAIEASYDPSSFVAGQPCDKETNRVMCRAVNEATGSFVRIAPADVTLACTPSCSAVLGNRVTVRVEGHFTLLTPLMAIFTGRQDLTLSSTSSARIATPPVAGIASTPAPTVAATATPAPSVSPAPSGSGLTPSPTASASPTCSVPVAVVSVNPTSGVKSKNKNTGTIFQFASTGTTQMSADCQPIWSWNFGDAGGQSSIASPTYKYTTANADPGFLVTLIASNSAGSSTATLRLKVTNQ
jgi:Flp pilus assembly protein TadG